MIYNCCNENRKAAVSPSASLNGIDFLEVLDSDAVALGLNRQQTLLVHCLNTNNLATLGLTNVMIEGGESITGIAVAWVSLASVPPPQANVSNWNAYISRFSDASRILVVGTNQAGDFSTYTLRLVTNATQAGSDPFEVTEVLAGFDPQLSEVDFSFKVECTGAFDCQAQAPTCTPPAIAPPPINYLAKDYGSFRQVMLDRLSQLLPAWNASNEADLGVALAEVIAYVADRLSYQQDAIATEAYLETARSRISLRRHALLVDYHVHDGCNARVWVQLQVAGNTGQQVLLDSESTLFYTTAPGMPPNLAGSDNQQAALLAGVVVFEPMQDAALYPEHNQMEFYTWGDANCCLAQGATEATLAGSFPNLQPGDVLIFQEIKGPQTGAPDDADIRHRCAVRLTQVATQRADGTALVDPLFLDSDGQATAVTEIQWSQEDALPFPVCISSGTLDSQGQLITNVTAALGNVVLADQGLTLSNVSLPQAVPGPRLFYPAPPSADRCQSSATTPVPVRYRPTVPDTLSGIPLTQAVPLQLGGIPVTPGIVMLNGTGYVSLSDSNNAVCLMVQAANPYAWPENFSVLATANPDSFDLSVMYNSPQGTAVTLETLTNLSFNQSAFDYVATQINQRSQFLLVPSNYTPPNPVPTGFSSTATPLTNTGTVNLPDNNNTPFLTVQARNPGAWPQNFGVLSQDLQQDPPTFNLVVVYNPPGGGVGVNLPVTVQQFSNVQLDSEAGQLTGPGLVVVKGFGGAPDPSLSASDLMTFDPADAVPFITLSGTLDNATTTWTPESDLLESSASDQVFVVETESNGVASLRFGDNTNGKSPDESTSFVANFRVGNGSSGNVGANSLIYLSANDARIQSCNNPLPATGGTDPETNDQIRRRAPQAFLTQERAITMADYEDIAENNTQVDRAVASLRWTGSWYTVFIAVQPKGGGNLSSALQQTLMTVEERYRLAGQDLLLDSPQYVALQIVLQVVVKGTFFQSKVEQALLQVLGNGLLPNGTKGVFYPDNFAFGQTVYLSPIYAAARSVPGVSSVTALTFQPLGVSTTQYLSAGEIKLGPLQVARLDNDPNFPDHGQLTLILQGGN
jgi:uncharacterized phage protein gp47/JayE